MFSVVFDSNAAVQPLNSNLYTSHTYGNFQPSQMSAVYTLQSNGQGKGLELKYKDSSTNPHTLTLSLLNVPTLGVNRSISGIQCHLRQTDYFQFLRKQNVIPVLIQATSVTIYDLLMQMSLADIDNTTKIVGMCLSNDNDFCLYLPLLSQQANELVPSCI